ncbi:hypothetical protein BV20DRAFT_1031177 [Pilatotrama ljubarskyi]|nr:hypothetical protein BV20DRAFT_1031177 [Pilatotrama ljubarskyi]
MAGTSPAPDNASRGTLLHSDYGKSSKELIEFVGQLRALGAHIDLELPRIVVIGNQSAGKSSLVEAISGISVPRDAGTCTRCPMECRLSHSPRWSCQVKIRYEYDENGDRCEEVKEVDFGIRLVDKTHVEPLLRRAQSAALNPDVPMEEFLDGRYAKRAKTKNRLQFSKNVVCVELTGPDLVDLSFVDLPGIVQNAEPEIVQLVEDMVNSYIQGNSLILVTLPMSDDIENQKAARLAQIADPKGLRTIGVLTKPDTLTAGSTKARTLWLDVLEGRRYPLLHGYYCTRQPDDDERARGVTGPAARDAEADFFKRTSPWAGLDASLQQRLGTTNLVKEISKLLTQIIRESLPTLLEQVATQLETCNAHLEMLPPAITTEPSAFVLALVTRFAHGLAARVHGTPAQLVQRTRRIYETFKDAVRSSAPPFVPYENAEKAPRNVSEYVWLETQAGSRKRAAARMGEGRAVLYLEDVRKHIRTSVTRELPGNVPYAAKVSLIQAFQQGWEDTALRCFEEVQAAFKEAVAGFVREEFDRYSNLKAIIGPVTMELINSCAETTTAQIRAILALETSPFTQNDHYLSESRDKYLAKYKDARAGKAAAERVTPALLPTITPAPASSAPVFTFARAGATSNVPVPATPSSRKAAKAPAKQTQEVAARNGSPAKKKTKPAPASASAPPKTTQASVSTKPSDEEEDGEEDESSSEEDEDEPMDVVANKPAPSTAATKQATIPTVPFSFTPAPPPAPSAAPPASAAAAHSAEEELKKEELLKEALSTLAMLGYKGLTEDDLGKLNKPDEFEEELQLMAEVRAYFQVAYKRVIDYVPLTIDHNFLYAFAKQLHERLFERLGLGVANAAQRCSAYIAEDPTVVAARDELLSKKRRLENVQRALFNFGL